jgi:hypothetical protein
LSHIDAKPELGVDPRQTARALSAESSLAVELSQEFSPHVRMAWDGSELLPDLHGIEKQASKTPAVRRGRLRSRAIDRPRTAF